jgi:hypothetical protein
MGFEPPSRTIHSITRQRQCDHAYCAPAFSKVNVLLDKMRVKKHSRRFDFSTVDLRKITAKHKQIIKKSSNGLLWKKTTCAKLLYS